MLEHTFVRTCVIARLRGVHWGRTSMTSQPPSTTKGMPRVSIQRYLRAAEQFAQWLQGQGYAVSEMDGDLVQRYISGLTRYRSGNLPKAAQGLGHLVRFLHQQGVISPRQAALRPPIEQWLVDYDAHLEQVAGLALSTRQGYRHLVRRFITACFGAEPPDWSSAHGGHDHGLCQPGSRHGASALAASCRRSPSARSSGFWCSEVPSDRA